MKPSAIIGIIIGIIAIIAGIVLCSVADASAKMDGYNLHEGFFDANGKISNSYSFSLTDSVNVTKIALEFDNADIIIRGGAEKSQVTVENILPGQYACFVSNKVISITNHVDLSTLIDSASILKFDGIRNFLDPELYKTKKAKVYIDINETNEEIKQLALDVNNCNVTVSNVVGSLDFRINSKKSQLLISDCSTDSNLTIEGETSSFELVNFEFNKSDITLTESSDLKFNSTLILLYRFDVKSDRNIIVNGETFTESFERSMQNEDYPLVGINSENSDITITVSQDIG